MKEYKISDYGIFGDAVSTTNSLKNEISNAKSTCDECKSMISNEAVFMGPIADSCVQGFSQLDSSITSMTGKFTEISQYLMNTAQAYKAGDIEAADKICILKPDAFSGSSVTSASAYVRPDGMPTSQADFIDSIKDGAVQAYDKYGVLPSLTLAQAALESAWGDSSIGNNIFGIKAGSGWEGKTQNVLTSEQGSDGSFYQIYADFRDYDSIDDSIVDHAELLSTERYKPVLECSSYEDACTAVKECGYATDNEYPDKLKSIIKNYNLDQWDPKN